MRVIDAFLALVWARLLWMMVVNARALFGKRRGLLHGALGVVHLSILAWSWWLEQGPMWVYAVLGIVGVALPWSAARAFVHRGVKNVASGTLDPHATVTEGEMIEHIFYQALLLIQLVYLRVMEEWGPQTTLVGRMGLCLLATSPWLARGWFPTNHFSDNYVRVDERSNSLVRVLYRMKKYQYLLYKHVLLHGLNVSVVLIGSSSLTRTSDWREYWMLLNASYVLEFFLQTLVKKGHMMQGELLFLNIGLMLVATICAFRVVLLVNPWIAVASLALNLFKRSNDFLNTAWLLFCVYFVM